MQQFELRLIGLLLKYLIIVIHSFQEDGETYVKTMSDCWIVGRKSDQREMFVILNQKNANLIEIDGKSVGIRLTLGIRVLRVASSC